MKKPDGNTTQKKGGYSLAELVVAVGLFALIMLLASGAYLMMIGLNRQAQSVTAGVNNLAFALEKMTRSIRTGTSFSCDGGGDCTSGGSSFSFTRADGESVTYSLSGTTLQETVDSTATPLTDESISIASLAFYAYGTGATPGDYAQPYVTIAVSGSVSYGEGESETFSIQTGAVMRGTDL